jgi:hypothetical protein
MLHVFALYFCAQYCSKNPRFVLFAASSIKLEPPPLMCIPFPTKDACQKCSARGFFPPSDVGP